jgi:hypothetical protein
MNHHNVTLSVQGTESDRQSLIQYVAATVRDLVRLAETGAAQCEMFEAASQAGTECTRMALETWHGNEPADVMGILRRLLRKEARRRWEASGEQDRDGDGNAALHHRKVSILLDAGADALGNQISMSKPAMATNSVLRRASPEHFGQARATLVS